MKNRTTPHSKNKYQSFEALKATLFPDLVSREKQDQRKQDSRLIGITWANESIDAFLSKPK